jgi:DNA polymerase-3 subunit gamma/tau
MAYQVLARKYRPQRFSDVAGQDHVTRTLTNALTQNRIAHGYIFSGHRGIGKTTIARILAMALNCRTAVGSPERPTVEPCLHCPPCREISSGGNPAEGESLSHSFDFIEIDAASNRGIDDVRSIISQAEVRPARDRYKIFLLDEAHQITDAAFNAILKTLEEPPDWVVFMMATTEPESIPQTIRSRCQHFSFHAVKFDDILAQLKAIAEKEQVTAEDAALALLAEAGDGSMRDALSIMDQAIASAPIENGRAVLQVDQIRELMGSVPNTVFERLMEAVSAGQSALLMEELDKLIASGNSPSALARQLVRYLRNCLMAKLGGENTSLLEIAHDERVRATRTAQLFSEEELTRNLQIALRTFDELNYRQEQRFHLELGLLKLIQSQRLLPMEEILSSLASSGLSPSGTSSSPTRRALASPAPSTQRQTTAPPAPVPAAPKPPSNPLSPFAASSPRAEVSLTGSPEGASAKPNVDASLAESSLPTRGVSLTEGGFNSRIPQAGSSRPLAPEANPTQPGPQSIGLATETTTGSPALDNQAQNTPPHPEPESGIRIVPPPSPTTAAVASTSEDPDPIRAAVVEALAANGHSTAAVMIDDAQWTIEGGGVKIAVNAKPTMIRITFNAAADRIIRQALSQAGAPSRFMIVPGEGTASNAATKPRIPTGSVEAEARSHPLVTEAQKIFNAEIVSVVDLRT